MKAKSMDLRERIVHLVTIENLSRRKAAERMMVGVSTAIRVMQMHEKTGDIAPKPCGGSVSPLDQHEDMLRAIVDEDGDATLDEIRLRIFERVGLTVSISAVDRAMARYDLRFKKKAS
jgi:transposase